MLLFFNAFLIPNMSKKKNIKEINKDTLERAVVFAGGVFLLVLMLLGFTYWFVFSKYDVSVAPKQDAVTVEDVDTQATGTEAVTSDVPQVAEDAGVYAEKEQVKVAQDVEAEGEGGVQNYEYGLSMGATLSYMEEREVAMVLDDIASLHIGWIRCDLSWNTIQNEREDIYNWTSFDRIVTLAYERGIEVLPIITYTPVWAREDTCKYTSKCPPKDIDQFAVFVEKAVERYEPMGVDTWEIWNEPNIAKFWAGGVNAYKYTQLLKRTYRTIHTIDPDAVVVSGGLAPSDTNDTSVSPREYLERMYENGAQGFFDVLGFHPYSFPLSPEEAGTSNAWTQMDKSMWSLRGIMEKNGDGGKKVWVTEFGAPTGGPGKEADGNSTFSWSQPTHVSEEFQADMFVEAYEYKEENEWMGPLFWYSYRDLGADTDTIENHFGILEYDGTPKEVYYVMQQTI